jgi:hypothetical protein
MEYGAAKVSGAFSVALPPWKLLTMVVQNGTLTALFVN